MYSVLVNKTRHKFVSRDNGKITRKAMSELFSCDYLTSHRNVESRFIIDTESSIKGKMVNFDYYEEYLTSISNNILLWQC